MAKGSDVTFTFTPDSGYEIDEIKVDEEIVATANSYTFSNVTASHTINVTFKEIPPVIYEVNVINGTADPTSATEGTEITIAANDPEDGKQFKAWTGVRGLIFTNGSENTETAAFTMPANEVNVTATYEDIPVKTRTITATAGSNGTISPNGSVTVADGGNKTFNFTPDSGYKVNKVTIDGTVVTTKGNSYTIKNITDDLDINVTFKKISSGGGSSSGGSSSSGSSYTPKYDLDVIYGSGDGSYKSGEWVTITAEKRDGKTFSHWISDEVTFEDKNASTTKLKMGSKDVKVTAIYEIEHINPQISNRFKDVKPSDWFHDSVYRVVDKGLFSGTTDTTFSPITNSTRATVWTVLARMADADLTDGELWYSKAQAWAMDKKVSDGTNPNNLITREQFIAMLWRNAGSPEVDQELNFVDSDDASDYAYKALVWAADEKIIIGKGENILDPKGNLTRAEMATILLRLTDKE